MSNAVWKGVDCGSIIRGCDVSNVEGESSNNYGSRVFVVDLKRKAAEAETKERLDADNLDPVTLQGHITFSRMCVEPMYYYFLDMACCAQCMYRIERDPNLQS